MFDNLTSLGYGVVAFAIVIGIGVVVLSKFGGAVANCPDSNWAYSAGNDTCCFTGNVTCKGSNASTPTGAWATSDYMRTQLGSSGLAGWAPAIIALAVGLLFLGAFLTKKGKKY